MICFHGVQPNRSDARGFVHKRIVGGVVGGVTGFLKGGPAGVVGGAVGGFIGGGAQIQPPVGIQACPPGFDPGPGGCVARVARVPGFRGRLQRFIPGGATGFEVRTPFQEPGAAPIRIGQFAPRPAPQMLSGPLNGGGPMPVGPAAGVGQAVVGRFGAGIEPFVRQTQIRDCPRGAVLAVDGLCYNRRDLRNSERFWPRGRRPLLTGGEMRAISTAASAARKLQRKQKDLQELGLLAKPAARRRKGAVAGHKATLTHA